MSIVKLENVKKDYPLGRMLVPALKGITLAIEPGEFVALAGPSGSGKTTALNCMGCIDRPSAGSVFIDGADVSGLSSDQLADIRAQRIGFIFQSFNLLPVLTALENVEYALILRMRRPHTVIRGIAREALASVGLESFSDHKPLELSGGQQQRVAIARAIAGAPVVVLADEPTANLDRATGEEILNLMKRINQDSKTTFIFSTHDQKIIDKADRVVHISDGRIV